MRFAELRAQRVVGGEAATLFVSIGELVEGIAQLEAAELTLPVDLEATGVATVVVVDAGQHRHRRWPALQHAQATMANLRFHHRGHHMKKGVVEADIETRHVEVSGNVTGNITSTEKVELKADGRMVGDIKAPRILIADGAVFKGNVDMER